MNGLEQMISVVTSQTIGILGNHDSVKMIPHMESLGIFVLLNESMNITKDKQTIRFIGVDDPSYYKTHDLQCAMGASNEVQSGVSVLLAHSPDLIQQASEKGVAAYLCGHTHGGQICLPGGMAIFRNTAAPRWSLSGKWHYQGMSGYTSVGVGTSIVEARYFCPPKITVHELNCVAES